MGIDAYTVIETGREDPHELFLATHNAPQSPPRDYLHFAYGFLWAAGSGSMVVPHPKPPK